MIFTKRKTTRAFIHAIILALMIASYLIVINVMHQERLFLMPDSENEVNFNLYLANCFVSVDEEGGLGTDT